MINNKSIITREEAHWSSFRSAVFGIQHSLLGSGEHYLSVSVDPPENDGGPEISEIDVKEYEKKPDPTATSASHSLATSSVEEEDRQQNNDGDKKCLSADPPENDVGICRTRENQALVDKVKKLSSGKKRDAPILPSADTEKEGVQPSTFSDSYADRQQTSNTRNIKPQSASLEFDNTENDNGCTLQTENSKANSSNSWDDKSIELKNNNNSHPQLELIGNLEEVKRNIQSRNSNTALTRNDMLSPMNAHQSHASHTTNAALSIAEQQLAETKLKLAMTEMERDELEFQLMQNGEQWN